MFTNREDMLDQILKHLGTAQPGGCEVWLRGHDERDITEHRKMQNRLSQIRKIEALGTMTASIAQNLKNVLIPIIVNKDHYGKHPSHR